MVTRTKARILGSFQTRKLTGNNGNVRHNGMKDGLVALRDENVVSFSSNKEGWGVHVGWWGLPSFLHQGWGVSIVAQPSARTISGWKNSKKTKSYKIFYNRPGAHEPACLSRCFLFWLKSCCIKKNSAFNVISRPFPWLWEIWIRDYI